MSEITFIYKGNEIPIQCSKGEKMKDIMERLSNKINISKNDIYGLYNGKILDEELKEDQIRKDENNKKIILIYEYDKSTVVNNIIKSNEVICPRCKENCLIKIKDYKIVLYNCKDNHETIIPINPMLIQSLGWFIWTKRIMGSVSCRKHTKTFWSWATEERADYPLLGPASLWDCATTK